jgi:H+/Cl- antiporter ClcA
MAYMPTSSHTTGSGIAAVPLTAVVFVAEYAGQATVVVPALLAATFATLVVGDRSISADQLPWTARREAVAGRLLLVKETANRRTRLATGYRQ